MENLRQYTTKAEVEKILESSGLPTYAKYLIAKEVAMNYEQRYFADVKTEYEHFQKSQTPVENPQPAPDLGTPIKEEPQTPKRPPITRPVEGPVER